MRRHGQFPQFLTGILALLLAIIIGGCFESKEAIISRSDAAEVSGLEGRYVTVGEDSPVSYSISPIAGTNDYRYRVQGETADTREISGTARCIRIGGDLLLLQALDSDSTKPYTLQYARVTASGGIVRRIEFLEEDAEETAALARKAGVKMFDGEGIMATTFNEPKEKVLPFLKSLQTVHFQTERTLVRDK